MMFYSPSTGGFYATEIHGAAMPTDAVGITPVQYQALLAGQSAGQSIAAGSGGVPELVTTTQPAMVPQSVTRRQARQALLLAGMLDSVQPAIDAIADPVQRRMMQIEWDDSQEFERQRPSLLGIAAALGLSSTQLDDLFTQAATL